MQKLSYSEVLKEIDRLRSQGIADTDPQIKNLKIQLWSHLEKRNKNKSTKVVPTVMAVRTVKLSPLGENKSESKNDLPKTNAKYVLLGVVAAIAMVCYKIFKKD